MGKLPIEPQQCSCPLQTFFRIPFYIERRQCRCSIIQKGPRNAASTRRSETSMSPAAFEGGRRGRRRGAGNLNLITSQLATAVPSFTWRCDLRKSSAPVSGFVSESRSKILVCLEKQKLRLEPV